MFKSLVAGWNGVALGLVLGLGSYFVHDSLSSEYVLTAIIGILALAVVGWILSLGSDRKVAPSNTIDGNCHFLLYGSRGWIGGQVKAHLSQLKRKYPSLRFTEATVRANNKSNVEDEIRRVKPTHIISTIGRTHGGNFKTIDYLQSADKTYDNIRDNLYAPMVLALLGRKYNAHFTYLGTGCIFGDDKNCELACKELITHTEEDEPTFIGSNYSLVKGFTDMLMHLCDDNTLNVRIRMPVTDTHCHRNLLTKLVSYSKIVNLNNSVTVLDELIPVMIDMALRKKTGTINLCNPNGIGHDEILGLYKEIIDNDHKWTPYHTIEEWKEAVGAEVLAPRSNCVLDTTKLKSLYPRVDDAQTAIYKTFLRMKEKESKQ